jgi:AraC-like DNA-binding protein
MQKQDIKCPVCNGVGKIEKAGKTVEARKRRRKDIAQKLRSEGYTIREIAALMGYKSPSTVDHILNHQ